MAFNLKEYIIYRNEIKRELFNGEVDENFKAVANPWVDNRTYDTGHIVYHPVEVLEPTGSTSVVTETLVWWRANRRTTQGVFVTAEWDIIGGIGTGDVTVGSSNGYGKIVVNYTGATPSLAAANDFTLNSTIANDTFRLIAGAGVQLQYDSTVNAIKLINSSAGGEINQGLNIGIGAGVENVFGGMSGTTLTFRGLNASNTYSTLGEPLALAFNSPNQSVVYNFDSSLIDLATLNNNSTDINSLGNVKASAAATSEFLQYDGSDWVNVTAAAAGLLGSQGVTGTQGLQGLQGNDGFGLQGTIGAQGIQGTLGIQGLQGVEGFGLQGTQGVQGEASTISGPPGTQGTQGVGLQGADGGTGLQGFVGTQGTKGDQGGFGGASFDYNFNIQTSVADPGFSYVSVNNTDQYLANIMAINDFGVTGNNISTFLETIRSSTSIPKGHVRITSQSDANEFILWQITEVYDRPSSGGTWWELDVVPVAYTENAPFIMDEDVLVSFVVTGDRGAQGTEGSGTQGTIGLQGTDGSQGTLGTQGIQGLQGVQGLQGTDGLQGIQGLQGTDGLQGTQGLQGLQGSGSQGVQGLQGLQGALGLQGITGEGTQGTQGLQGIDGSGSQGVQGLSGSISGSVAYGSMILDSSAPAITLTNSYVGLLLASGEINQMAYVASGGSPQGNVLSIDANEAGNYEINFTLSGVAASTVGIFAEIFVNGNPYGGSGTTEIRSTFNGNDYNSMGTVDILDLNGGDQVEVRIKDTAGTFIIFTVANISLTLVKLVGNGDPGTQGTQGLQGISGSGSQGTLGAQGIDGSQGIQGLDGSQGTQGLQGLDGLQGTQGLQGLDGLQGTQGLQGLDGSQGIQGLQGLDGSQGIQGALGVQGVQGLQGTVGNTGSQGTIGTEGLGSGCISGMQFGWTSVVNVLTPGSANEIQLNSTTTNTVNTIYIGTNIIHPVALNVGDTIALNVSQTGTLALYTVNSITGNIGYDALGVTFQTGNYVIASAGGSGVIFEAYTYCIYPASVAGSQGTQGLQGLDGSQGTQGLQGLQGSGSQGVQGLQGLDGSQGIQGLQGLDGSQGTQGLQGLLGVQGVQGLQGTNGLDNGCAEILGSNYVSQTPLNAGTFNSSNVGVNVADGGFTNNITEIFLGLASGVPQPSTGLPIGSTITISESPANTTTAVYTVTNATPQSFIGYVYDVTYVTGLDISNTATAHRVCTSTAGIQGTQGVLGVQGVQGLLGLQGTNGTDPAGEIVKSSFRAKFGLPRYIAGDAANSSFRIGGPDLANTFDGGGWNSAYWGDNTVGNGGSVSGVSGTQDQFTLMGNSIVSSKSYIVGDKISFRGVFVGRRASGAYTGPSKIGINLYKLKCGILGDGTNEWETIATTIIESSNVVYETTSEGEGRGRVCVNGEFTLDNTVSRFSEYLAVGFAASAIGDESFGGNDMIVSYLLFNGSDPQP